MSMFFWRKKGEPNEPFQGEFWLMDGHFRADEAISGMTGYYGIPGGYAPLIVLPELTKEWEKFHAIAQYTIEALSKEVPTVIMIRDYTQQCCALWEKQFPGLKQAALTPSKFFLESAEREGKQYLFAYERMPEQVHKALYRYINMEHPYEDIYLTYHILPQGTPLAFEVAATPEKQALLRLDLDWDHLVLNFQAAPTVPVKKIKETLASACKLESWVFFDYTKETP